MADYTTTASFAGPPEPVLAAAIATLTNNGFAIVYRSDRGATLTGPGLNSTRQNPLLGASRVEIAASGHTLQVQADLGGVASMRRFLIVFPILLGIGLGAFFAVFLGVLFGRMFGVGFGVPWAPGWRWVIIGLVFGLVPVAPWAFISPLVGRMLRNRTQRALDVLASNSAFAARPA